MTTRTPRKTPYAEFVSYNLIARLLERGGAYNYKELGEMVGLKPTHNFKTRVRQMVDHKMLDMVAAFTPRGGIEFRFSLPSVEAPIGEQF